MTQFDLSYWHDTTKTYAYFGVIGFFRILVHQNQKNCIFEIQWEIHFLKRHFLRQTPIFLYNSYFVIIVILERILDLGKCLNLKTCTLTVMCFLVGELSEVQNCFRKQFLHKVIYNIINFIFWSVSSLKNGA